MGEGVGGEAMQEYGTVGLAKEGLTGSISIDTAHKTTSTPMAVVEESDYLLNGWKTHSAKSRVSDQFLTSFLMHSFNPFNIDLVGTQCIWFQCHLANYYEVSSFKQHTFMIYSF